MAIACQRILSLLITDFDDEADSEICCNQVRYLTLWHGAPSNFGGRGLKGSLFAFGSGKIAMFLPTFFPFFFCSLRSQVSNPHARLEFLMIFLLSNLQPSSFFSFHTNLNMLRRQTTPTKPTNSSHHFCTQNL